MPRKLLITATGTEIGKTVVTAMLARQLRQRGLSVAASKPVSSGCEADSEGRLWSPDGQHLIEACGLDAGDWETHQRLCLERFAEPISPHMAAARTGRILSLAMLTGYCHSLAGEHVLVEGIGGVMTPLTDSATFLDWIRALDWPVVLVTGTYLGTLSHTLSALHCLRDSGATVAGVVLNRSPEEPVAVEALRRTLWGFHPDLPTVVVPRPLGSAPDLVAALGLEPFSGERGG